MSKILSFTDEQNRRGSHALCRLSFVQPIEKGCVDVWPETVSTGSFGADNRIGHARADELIAYMAAHDAPMVLGHIVKRIGERGVYGPIEIGFFHRIAEYAVAGESGSASVAC